MNSQPNNMPTQMENRKRANPLQIHHSVHTSHGLSYFVWIIFAKPNSYPSTLNQPNPQFC